MATEAGYDVVIHKSAERELANVTGSEGDELTNRLKQLQHEPEPSSVPYAETLEDNSDLFRVRVDGYRAICHLNPPNIEVVAVGTRSRIYDKIDTAKDRAGLD